MYICILCGKEFKHTNPLQRHFEKEHKSTSNQKYKHILKDIHYKYE